MLLVHHRQLPSELIATLTKSIALELWVFAFSFDEKSSLKDDGMHMISGSSHASQRTCTTPPVIPAALAQRAKACAFDYCPWVSVSAVSGQNLHGGHIYSKCLTELSLQTHSFPYPK